jgi:hypothetical protein
MKLQRFTLLAFMFSILGLGACQQEEEGIVKKEDISRETLDRIYQMGFGTTDVKKVEEGYLVEGDIVLTEDQLNEQQDARFLRIGEVEQYRTTNLVKVPLTIRVSIATSLPSAYGAALNEALARYNAMGLQIKFERVSSKAQIYINKAPSGANYLASAGFPSRSGQPYKTVLINNTYLDARFGTTYLASNSGKAYLATIVAHELGHCIGFRHTDYMDRSYSCGGATANEGASTVGAVHIPGTPTVQDPNSWMLACIGDGENRPFNANDRTALDYLY